jgi:hypothetical protein
MSESFACFNAITSDQYQFKMLQVEARHAASLQRRVDSSTLHEAEVSVSADLQGFKLHIAAGSSGAGHLSWAVADTQGRRPEHVGFSCTHLPCSSQDCMNCHQSVARLAGGCALCCSRPRYDDPHGQPMTQIQFQLDNRDPRQCHILFCRWQEGPSKCNSTLWCV